MKLSCIQNLGSQELADAVLMFVRTQYKLEKIFMALMFQKILRLENASLLVRTLTS